jgi:hypothetical protein
MQELALEPDSTGGERKKIGSPTRFRPAWTGFKFYRAGLKRPDEIWAKK